jgi:ribonuclease HI
MFDWDPEAPRAARQCEDNFNLSKYRWTLIAPEEEARFRPDRRFKRVQKRNPVTNDHEPHAELLSRASMESRAPRLAAKYADTYTPKYNWKQNGYFPDGSVIPDEDCHLVGAAVYSAREERAYLIQPNGQGPTNTINRAEGSAIFHVLNDICPPDEDALIFTDSQVCIQRLQKMIQHPHKLLHSDMDIHADLTRRTAELMLERAERGVATHLLKVKSHTGILGNEEADKAAKKAAQWPILCEYTTPAHNPFEGKTWLVYESSPATADRPPQQRAVANLGRGLKQAIRAATKLGFSRRTEYVRYWQDTYADPEGAHPASSNLFWTNSQITHGNKVLVLKARSGTLYNQKLAHRYKRAATDRCPLCGQPDSVGHILGGCRHRTLKGHYISRHDKAVRKIFRALQKGPQGGHFCIMDAGKMQTALQEAANGKRIPEWVLPDVDPDLLSKMRPDILRIKGLRSNLAQTEINEALHTKAGLTIQIIEVGYGPDTRWRETLAKKREQHARLKEALEAAGWEVEEHLFILGRAGTCYTHNLNTMMDLGITKEQATKLLNKLHVHAVTKLREIVIARRRLERNQQGKPPDTLDAG